MSALDLPTPEDFEAISRAIGQPRQWPRNLTPLQIRENQQYVAGYLAGMLQDRTLGFEKWAELMGKLKLPAKIPDQIKN